MQLLSTRNRPINQSINTKPRSVHRLWRNTGLWPNCIQSIIVAPARIRGNRIALGAGCALGLGLMPDQAQAHGCDVGRCRRPEVFLGSLGSRSVLQLAGGGLHVVPGLLALQRTHGSILAEHLQRPVVLNGASSQVGLHPRLEPLLVPLHPPGILLIVIFIVRRRWRWIGELPSAQPLDGTR